MTDFAQPAPRVGAPGGTGLIDRYILVELAKPLLGSLAVVLVALLMERVLRLFDLLAQHGGAFDAVLLMAANLVPHYLGLALPAAFFISMFVVVARMGEDNELDALQSSGLSVARIARPLLVTGIGLMVFSVLLFGFLQPYSRYAYRSLLHMVTNTAWDATVPETSFVHAGDGVTLSADMVDATGRELTGVFIHQLRADGEEWVTTAAGGRLNATEDRKRVLLTLEDGTQLRTRPDGRQQLLGFNVLTLDHPFNLEAPPFRARGGSERELTLLELWREMHDPTSLLPRRKMAAEFNGRLVRAVTLPLLPLLAVPMGMAAKRARRGLGITLAAVILVVYHHSVQLGESLADVGRLPAGVGVWVPFVLFALLCAWLFRRAQVRPGENPFVTAFERMDALLHQLGRSLPKRRKEPAA